MHGAFSSPRKTLGLRPTDQSCHHETWLHLDFVDWRNSEPRYEEPDRRILLKERPVPRSLHERATICTCTSTLCENLYILTK